MKKIDFVNKHMNNAMNKMENAADDEMITASGMRLFPGSVYLLLHHLLCHYSFHIKHGSNTISDHSKKLLHPMLFVEVTSHRDAQDCARS